MNMNKITIIIPVYNGSEYITRCLDSLAEQTFRNYVLLIVNDGSTDKSVEVICEWKQNNPDIDLILVDQENKGAAAARNKGIALADTEYIAFIDQDDKISKDYLEKYMAAMESSQADIVCGGYTHRYTSTKEITRKVQLKNTDWAKFVVVAPWAHLYRTDFLKSHPVRFLETKLGEDVYFSLMAYAYTDKIAIIPDTGYTWTNNPGSHSNKEQKKVQATADPFILLNAIVNDIPKTSHISDTQLEYYLYRYIVWYLLFTARQSSKEEVEKQYNALFTWLKERYPNYRRNKMISLFRRTGEPIDIRLSVWGFNALDNHHLLCLLLKAFSNKSN